jgi:AraC-like DNA-binding protein
MNETVDFSGHLEAIEMELRLKDQFQSDILRNLLHNLLLVCERFAATQRRAKDDKSVDAKLVTRFKELLDEGFAKSKKVSDYAERLKITEKRLTLATTKIASKSPKQMIDERILLEAKRLLSYTTQSVKEIAFALGFDEPTNFNKYFRKHVGSSPVEFRLSFR